MSTPYADVDIPGYVGFVYTSLLIVVAIMIYYYAEDGFPKFTYLTLYIGYYSALAILLLVPIDIASVVIDRRSTSPTYYVDVYERNSSYLIRAYRALFNIQLLFNTFVLVFEEYFNSDGYFTIIGRVISSFKRMTLDTILGVIAGFIILAILVGQNVVPSNSAAVMLAAIIVTNTIYETFLMFLLAYGLIEYPRQLWTKSNHESYLLKIQCKATSDYKDIADARLNVSLVVSDVKKTAESIAGYGSLALTDAMQLLLSECPAEFTSSTMGNIAANRSGQVTVHTLANLRTKLNTTKDRYRMAKAKVETTKRIAYYIEDLVEAKNRPDGIKRIKWNLSGQEGDEKEYKYHMVYLPLFYRISSLLLGVCSLFSFLGVICSMKGVGNNVSVYFLAIHSPTSTPSGITIFVLLTLGYAMYVSFWALFQIKMTGLVGELVPGCTTPESLSFNARMVGRLAAPLAFFYLGWISENGMKSGTWTRSNVVGTTYSSVPSLVPTFPPSLLPNTTDVPTLIPTMIPTDIPTAMPSFVLSPTVEPMSMVPTMEPTASSYIYQSSIQMPSAFTHFYQLDKVVAIRNSFGTIFPVMLIVLIALFSTNLLNRFLVLVKLGNFQIGTPVVTEEQLKEGKRQLAREKKIVERKTGRDIMMAKVQALSAFKTSSGFMGKFFGIGSGNSSSSGSGDKKYLDGNKKNIVIEKPKVTEPMPCFGVLQRKMLSSFSPIGTGYKEHFGIMKSPGYLYLYKDERVCNSNGKEEYVIDMYLSSTITVSEKEGRGYIHIDLSDKIEVLKFETVEEASTWESKLRLWVQYSRDLKMFVLPTAPDDDTTDGVHDVENGVHNNYDIKDLNSINIDTSLEMAPTSSFGQMKMFGNKKGITNSNAKYSSATSSEDAIKYVEEKPAALEGWLEKKSGSSIHVGIDDWHRKYCRLNESKGTLEYYKTSSDTSVPDGSIDLRMIVKIEYYEKGGTRDHSRFNIHMGDRTFKLKAVSPTEGERWVNEIEKWKNYIILYM